ncbi:hypothetical protein [Siminovitchia fortis]|uniref:hypothetical protein n=1 Tax=Siminovitchia fortis TaxID=254758 RepID=UPI00119E97F2|nr:hypothetical protein [Siminovitchia fortis]
MSQVETVLKDGMMYEVLTVEKYKKLKAEGVKDSRIMRKFGFSNNSLSKWKKENLTTEEIKATSLRKNVSAQNLPKVPHNKGQSSKKVISVEAYEKVQEKLKKKTKDIEVLELAVEDLKKQLEIEKDERAALKAECDRAIQEAISEKELAYHQAREWHENYQSELKRKDELTQTFQETAAEYEDEIAKLKEQTISDSYRIENLEHALKLSNSEIGPLRQLVSVYLSDRREKDVS